MSHSIERAGADLSNRTERAAVEVVERRHLLVNCGANPPRVATIFCTGGFVVIRKEAWPFYRTISGVRLCWELEEPKGPNGPCTPSTEASLLTKRERGTGALEIPHVL